jgi:beta-lysine 5,6-aminomutase beta subunit
MTTGIAAAAADLTKVKPYGDTMNDGMTEVTFTLPVPYGPEADEAARQLGKKMGLDEASVAFSKDLGQGFTFFVMYGKCTHSVDFTSIKVAKADVEIMSREECQDFIAKYIKREVVIVGATSGTDAHTVGIDAIMNMKGFHGHFGLERYKGIEAVNMGSQVPNEAMLAKAIELNADAVIVSQIVTQKDVHVKNLTNLAELAEAEGIRDRIVLCCGGPRISYELAQELGFDAGFGPHTYAEDVASFILTEMVRRKLV